MSRRTLGGVRTPLLLLVLLAVLFCVAIVLSTALGLPALQHTSKTSTPDGLGHEPADVDTEEVLASIEIPPLDPYDLARRLINPAKSPAIARQPVDRATPASPHPYSLGDRENFWALNLDTIEAFQVRATLRYIGPHLYMWVQDGLEVDQEALRRSAEVFEARLYPTVRRYFGSEWNPGIDNDPRLTILNARFSGALGYFSSSDEFPAAVMPYSNQREMFYINPEHAAPGSTSYESTLAHEFQHMVHWFADANEDAWVNEGAAELAIHLSGYSRQARVNAFARNPDTQLTNWDSETTTEHYGASFLMLAYFAERFGPEMTRDLVANEGNGIAGFESVLTGHDVDLSFQDLFADWVIANYMDGMGELAFAPYFYQGLDVQVGVERALSSYPATMDATVHQYGTDYIELLPMGQDVQVEFSGPATAMLVPNQAHSGKHQWWSNRGDNSDTTLTRAFDFSGLQQASLDVWLWYDIEAGWDYAYVEASGDGGETWQILSGEHTTTYNPSGNSYGPGYTGLSSAGSTPSEHGGDDAAAAEWVHEVFNLSPFAGQEVLIRFEYLTDEVMNHAGFCVDDIAVPELAYFSDAEQGDDGWVAQGFIRSDNIVPQRYIVQLIQIAPQQGLQEATSEVRVERLPLQYAAGRSDQDGQQVGSWTIGGLDQSPTRALLVISAAAPSTTEVASYHLEIYPAD
jgi:immune inhibitor A